MFNKKTDRIQPKICFLRWEKFTQMTLRTFKPNSSTFILLFSSIRVQVLEFRFATVFTVFQKYKT